MAACPNNSRFGVVRAGMDYATEGSRIPWIPPKGPDNDLRETFEHFSSLTRDGLN